MKLEFSASIPWLGEELGTMKASRFTEAQKAFVLKHGEVSCHVIFPPSAIRVRPKEGTDDEANDTKR